MNLSYTMYPHIHSIKFSKLCFGGWILNKFVWVILSTSTALWICLSIRACYLNIKGIRCLKQKPVLHISFAGHLLLCSSMLFFCLGQISVADGYSWLHSKVCILLASRFYTLYNKSDEINHVTCNFLYSIKLFIIQTLWSPWNFWGKSE